MDIADITAAQRGYYESGATRSFEFRKKMLKKLRDALISHEEELLSALKSDLNKPECEGYMTEMGMILTELSFQLSHLSRFMRERRVAASIAQFAAKSFLSPEPYGLVLIISPWNYPLQLCIEPLIGALAAGNCAVVKPSAYAPNVSRAIARLIADTFPPEYVAAVEGGRAENASLLSQRFDYIFFTGSVEVGRVVMEAAARHLTPMTLELGGKSPVIVDETADLPLAAKRLAFGKYLNAGQTCIAPDYLFVQEGVADSFLALLKRAVEDFFPDGYADMPVIVNEKHYRRIMGLIAPEKIYMGGWGDEARRFIEPTVLTGVTGDSPVMREEIFGPVLPVLTYKSIEEPIAFINSREKPLALYLFTRSAKTQKKVLSSCSFGGGCINDTVTHAASTRMGFGGVGASGMGSYHGKCSFDTFTHYRSIVKSPGFIDLLVRYRPYTDKKLKLIRFLMK